MTKTDESVVLNRSVAALRNARRARSQLQARLAVITSRINICLEDIEFYEAKLEKLTGQPVDDATDLSALTIKEGAST